MVYYIAYILDSYEPLENKSILEKVIFLKEHIYTIPVLDAFKSDSECPLCELQYTLEQEAIEYMLGASYMEDDIRMETNKIGFCAKHYEEMYTRKNRLGLALMLHTHLQQINQDLSKLLGDGKTPPSPKKSSFLSRFADKTSTSEESTKVSDHLQKIHEGCYICNKANTTFDRYVDTIFYLWKKDSQFIELVKNCKGFCLHHFDLLINEGARLLPANTYTEFCSIVVPLQLENLQRIEEEIEWFTRKFDYRFENEPWKNSKDAVPRTIQKIASTFVERK